MNDFIRSEHDTCNRQIVCVKLFGGRVDDPVVKALYEFQCTAPELHDASRRLRSELVKRLEALAANSPQLPIAVENAWVGAMLAVVKSLTVRARSPDDFDDERELVVRDGLCATVEQAGEAVQDDDKIEIFLSRDTDLTIRIRRKGSPFARTVELGNINRLVSRIGIFGNPEKPSIH